MERRMSKTPDIEIEGLTDLALDLLRSWSHSDDEVWAQFDPELWALTHNPWVVLQAVSPGRVQDVLARPDFRRSQ